MTYMMIYVLEQVGTSQAALHLGLYKERDKAEVHQQYFIDQLHIQTYIKTYPLADKDTVKYHREVYELQFRDDVQWMTIGFYAKKENACKAKQHYMGKKGFSSPEAAFQILTYRL